MLITVESRKHSGKDILQEKFIDLLILGRMKVLSDNMGQNPSFLDLNTTNGSLCGCLLLAVGVPLEDQHLLRTRLT